MAKPGLGRGLGALLSGGAAAASTPSAPPAPVAPAPPSGPTVRKVPLSRIRPSPLQPRKDFPAEALEDLAASIREQGIVQPLLVRVVGDHLELIAGERRWRAAQLAGLTEAPVLERAATDAEVLELALIENLQRENLNAVEEALGYQELATRFGLTQDEVARKVGKSRAAVANALRLLRLPEPVQSALREGRLSVGHAKVILGLTDPVQQLTVARRVEAEGLTVRQTEELVARILAGPKTPASSATPSPTPRDPHVTDLEGRLRERLGTRVALRYKAGRGALEIRFTDDDELNRVLDILGIALD
ncbi:MAG: ParB/RepB/Spo0J family partition protein [Verrucomicrobiales bacterium]|nr:ParB/RepB/Spo0J family partition protein [Verrucomicrobiales bacterium]